MKKRGLKRTSGIFAAGILLLLSTIILPPTPSQAQTPRYWIGGTGIGNWNVDNNWWDAINNKPGVPETKDYVCINTSGAIVNYDTNVELGYLEIGYDSTLSHNGTYSLTVDSLLNLGFESGSKGTYNLSGGDLTAGEVLVGYMGTGTFNQTGGTHNITGGYEVVVPDWGSEYIGLDIGSKLGSAGTYTLTSGLLDVSNITIVGNEGTGVFNLGDPITRTGDGTHNTAALYLGFNGGSGTYNLYSGTLNVWGFTVIGGKDYNTTPGIGEFNQYGGEHNTGGLFLGDSVDSTGTYNLIGGDLTVSSQWAVIGARGIGTFNQTGGTFTTGGLEVGGAGTGTYNLELGKLTVNENMYVGNYGKGTFTQTGGTATVNGDLVLAANPGTTGTYNLSGDSSVSLWVGGNELIGWGGTGSFTQTGGTHTVMGDLNLGQGEGTTGTFALSNGDLNVDGSLNIGHDGLGKFTQYSGTNKVGYNLVLGNNPTGDGTYTMEGGSLSTHQVFVGLYGTGTFTQNGGTHSIGGQLAVAHWGSGGTYNLNGGTLNAGFTQVGITGGSDHPGVFNQTGGDFITNGLWMANGCGGDDITGWCTPGSYAYYNLSDGGLTVNGEARIGLGGYAVFNQTGGSATFASLIVGGGASLPGVTPATQGIVNLTDGKLHVTGDAIVGAGDPFYWEFNKDKSLPLYGGMGTVNQTGGKISVGGNLILGQAGSNVSGTGSYNLSGTGNLQVTGSTIVGQGGIGIFTQTGGSHTTGTLSIAENPGSIGTYNMMGGILNAVNIINNGAFNFTGGTLSPGLSPGTLNFVGNYIQGDLGKLLIELAGYTQGTEYDFLNITGTATLGGTLDIDLLPGFDPIMGNNFNILYAKEGVFGTFAFLDLPLLGGGKGWEILYGSNDVTVHVTPVPSTLLLLGSGLIGIVGLMRRKLKR